MEEFEKTTLLFDCSIRIKNKKGATQTKPNVHIVHDFGCVRLTQLFADVLNYYKRNI